MRLKGKLISWDEEKAFGFIKPNSGGQDVFIHKRAFINQARTPKLQNIITFTLSKDKQGRNCASEATFSGEKLKVKNLTVTNKVLSQVKVRTRNNKANKFLIYLAIIFLSTLSFASYLHKIPPLILYGYWGASLITFFAYGIDKVKAQMKWWRISESTLHLLALVGGWPGAAIAQQVFRHKSQKRVFRQAYWFTVITNCCVFGWLISPYGKAILILFDR